LTVPETSTESPTTTPGEEVNTKIPSLVALLESAVGSWIQKPRLLPVDRTAVTMPGTLVTCSSSCGEIQLPPWMSWMRSGPGSPVPPPPSPALPAAGVGSAAAKSPELSSLSAASLRCSEVVFEPPGAAAVSLITAAP
jgi:hypothetical protein